MKKILLNLGDPIASLSSITNMPVYEYKINHNPENMNQSNTGINTFIDYEYLMKTIDEKLFTNKLNGDNFFRFLNSEKKNKSLKNLISFQDFKKMFDYYIVNLKKSGKIAPYQEKEIIDYNIHQIYSKFIEEFEISVNSIVNDITKKIKKVKVKSNIKRVLINNDLRYTINIDQNEVNSKKLNIKFHELEAEAENIKEVYSIIENNINSIQSKIKNATIASIATTAASVLSSVLSFFFPFIFAFVSVGTSVVSLGITFYIDSLKNQKEALLSKKEFINKLLNIKSNTTSHDDWYTAFNYIWGVTNGITGNVFRIAMNYKKLKSVGSFASKLVKAIPSITFTGIDLASLGVSIDELNKLNKETEEIQKFLLNLTSKLNEIDKYLDDIRKIEWVVMKETVQTDSYENGGTGGRNLLFKNLKTGEFKTIDQMLSVSEWQLYEWGLQKVYNPAKNIWYIRKLPNKTKLDNLG
ncbi:hypothetical protein ACXYRR_02025 [Mycoplasma sp. 246B]